MRHYRQISAIAIVFLMTLADFCSGAPAPIPPRAGIIRYARSALAFMRPFVAVSDEDEPNAIVFVRMSGTCKMLRIGGRDLQCRAVAFVQNEEGRASFTVAIDDPDDDSHIISFSGDNGRKTQDNLYELPIDRMLLKSKDRPKADGLPVALIDPSAGMCRQIGSFLTKQVSSISCAATDKSGKKYEFEYASNGTPVEVLHIKQRPAGSPSISPFD